MDQLKAFANNKKYDETTRLQLTYNNATGSYIPMKIVKSAKYFPGTSDNNDFILVDLQLLKNYLELTKLQSFRPNELVVDIQSEYQEKISEYVIENFPLSSIKDKSIFNSKTPFSFIPLYFTVVV